MSFVEIIVLGTFTVTLVNSYFIVTTHVSLFGRDGRNGVIRSLVDRVQAIEKRLFP